MSNGATMRGSALGLVLALLMTGAIFGGAWLLIQVIIPAMGRGESMPLLRWGAVALIGAVLVYRLVSRYRRGRSGGFE